MNENYLHFLWKTKRLPFHKLKTSDNLEIGIKHVGFHNTNESGPDFINGKIILDGLEWCGNIELHVKSSDWYLHKHQYDLAYNNVILHVVYEHDRDIHINNTIIPTIELKEHIDWNHFECFQKFSMNNSEINCSKSLPNVNRIYIESMIERSIVDRLNRKIFFLNQDVIVKEPSEVLYFLLARAFGTKVNQLPFEELTYRLPLSLVKKLKSKEQVGLIILTSGISPTDNEYCPKKKLKQSNRVSSQSWKRKGLRPQSFPEVRVMQFAVLVSQFDFNMLHFMKSSTDLRSFILSLFDRVSKEMDTKMHLSKQLVDLIIINCIVPFLWWYGDSISDSEMKEKAFEILQITSAEKNTIIKTWNSYNIKAKSAYESQALIELYNEHCSKNKCLSCEIGVQILKA